ncbi:MAG TPA: LysR family transcriptional regulator [Herbaspirillum sp.]|jgi:DNA-binding transcriptional LysR family regulator
MDRWTEFELFVQTAELKSLSRASEILDISNATATRMLNSLEARLDARLVERNTRGLALTEVGEAFYLRCKCILEEMKDAEAAANATSLEPSGLLRITGSQASCMKFIVPMLPRFAELYPDIDIELVSANRYFDLIENGIDVAIRTREYEPDNNITVRKLAATRRILAASPAYLARHGTPRTIEELQRHKFLLYTYMNRPNELHLTRGGESRDIKVGSSLQANDGQLLREAALNGSGVLVQIAALIHDDIEAGLLAPIMNEWDLPRLTINIAYRTRKHLPAKVRVFIDFMVEYFRQMDSEKKWTN